MEVPGLWQRPRLFLGHRPIAQPAVPEIWSSCGNSSSSSCTGRFAQGQPATPWMRLGVGAGLALAARTRTHAQPMQDPRLAGLSMLNQELAPAEAAKEQLSAKNRDDDESWVFWEEQLHPTPGPGNKPRDKTPETLPSPLPSLQPPKPAEGDDTEDQAASFEKAYRPAEPTIMDSSGSQLKVPMYSTFEEAVSEFAYPPFLQAAFARRGFYYLTPVQQCSLPLMRGGHDFLASAFTGSGKTAAYLIPILKTLHEVSRLIPGTNVACHYKTKDNSRSAKPGLGVVKGIKRGQAAIEFEAATGKTHRQLVPVDWVVGAPDPPPQRRWQGPAVPKAVVLVPTRELSEQVHMEAKEFLHYSPLRSVAIYGDANLRSQFRDLAHGADILVATPGRLIDALHKGMIRLDEVRFLVLDEVDRMMELGFGSQLEEIVTQGAMPGKAGGRQTSFWSATIPLSVRELAEAFLGTQCTWVDCTGGQTNPVPTTISHIFIDARPPHRAMREFQPGDTVITKGGRRGIAEFQVGRRWRVQFDDHDLVQHKMLLKGRLHHTSLRTDSAVRSKLETLKSVLESREFEEAKIIIFCRRRDTVMDVYHYLKEHFEGVVTCHGGMTQSFRSKSIKALKEGDADILIATDIAARGLDVQSVTHVINYELPLVLDEFVHRIGRTGRIGRQGTAVTFVTGREKIFAAMRRMVKQQGNRVPEWFNLQGLQLAWRPRNYKLPFTKVRKGIPQDAPPEVREAYMEKNRDMQRRTKSKLMSRMADLESAPLDPRELRRRSIRLVEVDELEDDVGERPLSLDAFENEPPMVSMEGM